MNLLGEIVAGDQIASGIFPGLTGEAPLLWYDGDNVIFDNGGVRKGPGLLGLENLAATPTGIKSTVAATESRAFVGAGTIAYRYRTADGLTNIGSFAASGGVYQFLPWDTWCLISNGVDPVELWQNAGSSAAITAPFTRANTLFGYQLQAFVGGTSNGGKLVEWSPVNAVLDWTQTATGTAGQLNLRELAGDIVAARPIGNSIGVYSQSNAGLFSFIGGTSIYGFRKPISGVSAISPYSVISFGDRHYGMTRENVFLSDLVSFYLIDEPAVRTYIKDNADWDRITEVYGWPDWANNIARWQIPKLGGGKFGLGYRIDKNSWTKFNDSVILGEERGAFSNQLLAKTSRLLRQDPSTGNNDGSAMSAFVQTKPLAFGDRNRFKRVMKLSIDGVWSGTVNVLWGYTNHPNETPTFSITKPIANEIYMDELSQQSEGVYVSLKIESTAAGATWKINGCKIFGEFTGLVNI